MAYSLIASSSGYGRHNPSASSGIDTTGADLLVVVISVYNLASFTFQDNKSNTWTALTAYDRSGIAQRTRVYYCVSPSVGSGHTVTLTGTDVFGSVSFSAWSGAASSGTFDVENGGNGAGNTTIQTGSVTPTYNNSLLVYGSGYGTSGLSATIDVGTELHDITGVADISYPLITGYQIQTTATARNPQFTFSTNSGGASAAIAVFKAADTGGGAVTVNTGAGALAITGHAPTILGGNTNVAVGAGALAITGAAPNVTTQEAIATGAGALTLTGHAPTIQVVAPGEVEVPSAALTLTGHAPTVTTQIVVSPDIAALALTGYAPTLQVVSDTTVQTGVGALAIAGHAPTVSILLNVLPGVGQIIIEGHAPTVTGGTPSVVVTAQQAGGGKARKPSTRRRKPILINVDGEEFVVSSEAEAVDLIEKACEAAEANARAQSATILEKRKLKAARDGKLNTTPLRLDEPSITVTPAQDGYVDKAWVAQVDASINDAIRDAYESAARDAETQLLLAQRIMVDEEDALVALLLTL